MSQTRTASSTYTMTDIKNVVRRVQADLIMIAESTGAWTLQQVVDYAHDIEVLAKAGYLAWVDVTLLKQGIELKAVRFKVNTEAGMLRTSRPGGVLWPRVAGADLRIVLHYTGACSSVEKEAIRGKLRIRWTPTFADNSHSSITSSGGRDYVSSAYGMQREDWSA